LWDRRANLPRGSAYIQFFGRPDAEKAQSYMDGGQIDGNVIRSSFVLTRKRSPIRQFNGGRGRRYSPRRRGGFRGYRLGPMRRSPPRRRPLRRSPYRRRNSFSRSPSSRRRSFSRSPRRSISRSPMKKDKSRSRSKSQ